MDTLVLPIFFLFCEQFSGLNCAPPKNMCKLQPLVPMNVNLFGYRVFADITKDLEMRSHWIQGRSQIQRLAFLRERRERFETKSQMRRPRGERQRLELCHHKPKNSRCDRYHPLFLFNSMGIARVYIFFLILCKLLGLHFSLTLWILPRCVFL